MTVHIKELKELSEKFRCGNDCSVCPFLKDCKYLDEEKFKYSPQCTYLIENSNGKDVHIPAADYLILPLIKINHEEKRKKLFDLLYAINHMNYYGKKCNAETLAEYLGVSIKNIRKRLAFLKNKEILEFKEQGRHTIIQFFDKKDEKTLKQKELLAIYNEYFYHKFFNKPYIEPADFAVIKNFVKKTEFNIEQIRKLLKEYFLLDHKYLKETGYKLRNFPSYINSILVKNPDVINVDNKKENKRLTQDELNNYLEGKRLKKWDGTEEWAKQYEQELSRIEKEPNKING